MILPTLYEFIQAISQVLRVDTFTQKFNFQVYTETAIYIAKMIIHDYEIQNSFRKHQLAAGIVLVCLRILAHVDKNINLD